MHVFACECIAHTRIALTAFWQHTLHHIRNGDDFTRIIIGNQCLHCMHVSYPIYSLRHALMNRIYQVKQLCLMNRIFPYPTSTLPYPSLSLVSVLWIMDRVSYRLKATLTKSERLRVHCHRFPYDIEVFFSE